MTLDGTLSFGAAQQLHVDDGLPLVEHTPKQRLAFFAKLWLELTDELSNVRRGGLSIELSKRVIHAQIAKLAVEQRESDRRARDDHIEEGQRVLSLASCRFDLGRHGVEGRGQPPELVLGRDTGAAGVIAIGDAFGRARDVIHWTRNRAAHSPRGDDAERDHEQRDDAPRNLDSDEPRRGRHGVGGTHLHHMVARILDGRVR